MADPTPTTDRKQPEPRPILTYLKGVWRVSIVQAAFRGAQTAIAAAVFLLVGGAVFALIGKPAYLAALWIWQHVWNF